VPILKREADLCPHDLFERWENGDGRPWWVAHLRSRQEKLLARFLREQSVAYYLPQYEKTVRRAGRTFVSYLPLFPGYVFFRGSAAERRQALQSNVIVQVLEVRDQGRLEGELAALWRLQSSGAPLVPWQYLGPGDEVEITDGPFRGLTGTVLREKGALRLVVSVTFLRQSVAAEIDREIVAPLAPAAGAQRRAAGRG
jgi:transcription antitermination factor NusG